MPDFRPNIGGLDDAFQNELAAAKGRPGSLESVLGMATALPIALGKQAKAKKRRGQLGEIVRSGQVPEGFEPNDIAEANTLDELVNRRRSKPSPEDALLPPELSKGLAAKLNIEEPPGGFTYKTADYFIRATQATRPQGMTMADFFSGMVGPGGAAPVGDSGAGRLRPVAGDGPPAKKYKSAEEVRDDASLSREQKLSILRSQFGYK